MSRPLSEWLFPMGAQPFSRPNACPEGGRPPVYDRSECHGGDEAIGETSPCRGKDGRVRRRGAAHCTGNRQAPWPTTPKRRRTILILFLFSITERPKTQPRHLADRTRLDKTREGAARRDQRIYPRAPGSGIGLVAYRTERSRLKSRRCWIALYSGEPIISIKARRVGDSTRIKLSQRWEPIR